MQRIIHAIDYGSQPDLRVACLQEWTTPAWKQPEGLPEGIYLTESQRLYSFTDSKITCWKCRCRMK